MVVAAEAVSEFALRLAERCRLDAEKGVGLDRAEELWQMAFNLKTVPSGPARTFWQALQSVWLLHLVFHSTMNGNAVGRLDQYA